MATFKDILEQDSLAIFNPNEFGETHNINGKDMTVIVDNEELSQRSKIEYQGISVGEVLYYVSASVYGDLPEQEEQQIFDGRPMVVFDAREEDGIYEIILHENR